MSTIAIERKEMARVSLAGILAGLVAGFFISLLLLIMMAVNNQDVWLALKGASAPFFRNRAMQPGFDALTVMIGIVSHFTVSAIWGWLFALVFYGMSRPATIFAGAFWGIVVWLGMYYVVLPIFGLSSMVRGAPVGMAILEHVVFGLMVAVAFAPNQRRVPERWPSLRRTVHG